MRLVGLAAIGLALCMTACQAPPPAAQRAAPRPDPTTEAWASFARRDWATAAPLFREAIGRQPDSVPLHYSLAVCASYLSAFEEAAKEFRWVLEHAPPGSEEASVARSWLAQASVRPVVTAAPPATGDSAVEVGRISGFITWSEPGQPRRGRERQIILLQGIRGTPTAGQLYRTRTDERGHYEMNDIPAGPYKVTDAIAGQTVWRLKVVIDPGRPVVLDLSPDNSISVRDDFPEANRAS